MLSIAAAGILQDSSPRRVFVGQLNLGFKTFTFAAFSRRFYPERHAYIHALQSLSKRYRHASTGSSGYEVTDYQTIR